MNPEFTRFQQLPFVMDPTATDTPAMAPESAHGTPQGPGLRQPSAALASDGAALVEKRQRTGAVQDAGARIRVATFSRV
jgi:hypothetical protein